MTIAGSAKLSLLWRYPGLIAACLLLAAFLSACGGDPDAASERVLGLEAKVHSLEESLEVMQDENAALKSELATLRLEQADFLLQEEAAESAEEHKEEASGFEEGQEEQLAALEEEQSGVAERLDELDSRLQELEGIASQVELVLPALERWFTSIDKRLALLEGTGIGRTLKLAAEGGGQAKVINYGAAYGRERSAVLALPDPLPEGEIPLIVSLHGFGGDSFAQGRYVPFHKWVNRDGFALLLPDGAENAEGQRFWNPSDGFGDAVQDDVGALTALVQEARGEFDLGPVYIFGYSNGGFMSYWVACRGLAGLRAIASLAGTSYMDDAACDGTPPVSVLHIHGTDDAVVRFDGIEGGTGTDGINEPGYAGAQDMVRRWGERAGCDWPEGPQPYATLGLDAYVPGDETQAYRLESGCGDGISIELWMGEGSSHGPGYGDAFTEALLDWLLAQQ